MEQSRHPSWISFRQIMATALFGALLAAGLGRLTSSSPTQISLWAGVGGLIGVVIELCLSGLHWLVTAHNSPRNARLLRHYGLAGLWLLSLPVFMWGGFDAQSSFKAWFGKEAAYPWSGVILNIGLSGLVVLVLYGIIRPWSFRHSVGRLALALIVLIVGFVVIASPMVDPPGFQAAQVIWLLMTIGVMFVMLNLTFRARKMEKSS